MSSGSCGLQVKKVLKKIVDDVVRDFEKQQDSPSTAHQSGDAQSADSDVRRSGRSRKEPERLASIAPKAAVPRGTKRTRKEQFDCVLVMDPAPADLRGILRADRPYPPPRKSSLSAQTGKNIANKYRKVRVSRRLQYKLIPPLPGWRADKTRMPEDDPDEGEQQRLEELEQEAKKEAQKKKRKRKSIGVSAVPSVSEDDASAEEISTLDNPPQSPDVYYEDYMRVNSPDSVLTTDSEMDEKRDERRKAVAHALFTPIEERPNEEQVEGTVAADAGTVAAVEDTVVREEPPIDIKKRTERRRSVRIQPPEEPKAVEKKERRKSKIFPATPVKVSPLAKESKPVEKSVRRRSGVIRAAPAKKEETTVTVAAKNPYEDKDRNKPCRSISDEDKAAATARAMERKTTKVMAWLERSEAPAGSKGSGGAEGADGESLDTAEQHSSRSEEIESIRSIESRDTSLAEKSGSNTQLVEAKLEQAKRKGRRSMKMSKEDVLSKSKSKSEAEDKKKTHPFFAQFAPKPSPVQPPTVATVPEKKQARRRSMFMPKNPSVKDEKKGEKEKTALEEEDVVEIVEEIVKGEKKEEEGGERGSSQSSSGSTSGKSIWRSSEIDAAPYAGLVHVGREESVMDGEGREDEVVVKKMRRMSMRLQAVSSYAIPSSLREKDSESDKMVPVFDEERTEDRSERAASLVERAAAKQLAADPSVVWLEAMRPTRVEECIGDEEVLASGKRWLQKWKKRLDKVCAEEEKTPKPPKAKKRKRKGGSYSDGEEQEDSDSDFELRDEDHGLPNPLVLCGPIGCGKTAYIRALSSEIGFSLLESSPDESRTGANMKAKLLGAIANHSVSSKPAGGISSFFSAKSGGEEKKKEEKRGRLHTLVVIEHVDVVFAELDKLFWPALAEILATTKIPIVLTCNVVPDELSRLLRTAGETGAEPIEMTMHRGDGRITVEEYVQASLAGSSDRAPSSTVIPGIVTRARHDLRAALLDAHWAAAAETLSQKDLVDMRIRRVDEPAMCDTVAHQTFAWLDECARRAEMTSTSELSRVAQWPARCGMPGEEYGRLCTQIDEIDQDAYREAEARRSRMIEMARSGVGAGNGGRSGLLTRREIATDWMPILAQIDKRENEKKKEYGRRYQHYFNAVHPKTGLTIDPLDRIQGACAFFRLPTPSMDELQ